MDNRTQYCSQITPQMPAKTQERMYYVKPVMSIGIKP